MAWKTKALQAEVNEPGADEGIREIDAWGAWLRAAHAERLRDYPDPNYLAEETARTESQIAAIVERMKYEYLLRQNVKR